MRTQQIIRNQLHGRKYGNTNQGRMRVGQNLDNVINNSRMNRSNNYNNYNNTKQFDMYEEDMPIIDSIDSIDSDNYQAVSGRNDAIGRTVRDIPRANKQELTVKDGNDLDEYVAVDAEVMGPDGSSSPGLVILPDEEEGEPEPVCEPSSVSMVYERQVNVLRGPIQTINIQRDECGNDVGKTQRIQVDYVAGAWNVVSQSIDNPSIHSGNGAGYAEAQASAGDLMSGLRAGHMRTS